MARLYQIVIVGAASTGCSLALALVNHGIQPENILLIDERAGTYLRPGMIAKQSISSFVEQLGLPLRDYSWKESMSIKDLDRMLYQLVIDKNIHIENKAFLRMHADSEQPGVIIGHRKLQNDFQTQIGESEEERIVCQYVFDCTGTKRAVLTDMIKVLDQGDTSLVKKVSTFQPRTHYIVASIKIPRKQKEQLLNAIEASEKFQLYNQTALEFTQHLTSLHSLGWDRWYFPYMKAFNNFSQKEVSLLSSDESPLDKVCLYLEAPSNLQGDPMAWINGVTQALCNVPLSIALVHPSKKYGLAKDKLRLQYFQVRLDYVTEYLLSGEDLPIVIPQGDAVQTPFFEIGHGFAYTCQRIKACLNSFTIEEGALGTMNRADYRATMAGICRQ